MARIELRKRGPIGEIRLNRPEVLNAMGHEWPEDMLAAAREMQEDAEIRVVLVNKIVPRANLEIELEAWAQRYLEVPRPSLTWAKRLSNQSLDLAFEQFVPVFDQAMEAVIASEEHQAARKAWLERIAERQRQRVTRPTP